MHHRRCKSSSSPTKQLLLSKAGRSPSFTVNLVPLLARTASPLPANQICRHPRYKLRPPLPTITLLLLLVSSNLATSLPITVAYNNKQGKYVTVTDVDHYLEKYGYMQKHRLSRAEDDERMIAVAKFQQMAHLPITGKVDTATVDVMQQPRCGFPDDAPRQITSQRRNHKDEAYNRRSRNKKKRRKRDVNKREKRYAYLFFRRWWANCELGWDVIRPPTVLKDRDLRKAFGRATSLWTSAVNANRTRPVLTMNEVGKKTAFGDKPSDNTELLGVADRKGKGRGSDIEISFYYGFHGDDQAFDGPGGELAHAFYPDKSLSIGGDIHFDEGDKWVPDALGSVEPPEGIDFMQLALHELGHSLGLRHSDNPEAVMYGLYRYRPNITLHQDDVDGIRYLYPLRLCNHFVNVGKPNKSMHFGSARISAKRGGDPSIHAVSN